jgi:hypothetical protein
MNATTHRGEDVVDEVNTWLCTEFGDHLPSARITGIVREARADLDGQIIPGALGEMLHRLARFRVLRTLNVPLSTFD